MPLLPTVVQIIAAVAQLAGGLLTALMPVIVALVPALAKILMALLPILPTVLNLALLLINQLLPPLLPIITLVAKLAGLLIDVLAVALTVVAHIIADLVQWLADLIGWIAEAAGAALRFIAALDETELKIASWFLGLGGKILGWIGDFNKLLYNAGMDLLKGLLDGIESQVSAVVHAATNVGGAIKSGIKDVLGIFSPSREAHILGAFFSQGLGEGVTSGIGDVTAAARAVANAARGGLSGGLALAGGGGLALPGAGGGVLGSASQPLRLEMTLVHQKPSGAEINRELIVFQQNGGVFTAAKKAVG
jgi:hypothetical protein